MSNKMNKTEGKTILVIKAIVNCILVPIFFGLPIFLPAGSLRFLNAWLFLGLVFIFFLFISVYFALKNPVYLNKRLKYEEKEGPQKVIKYLLTLSALTMLVVSGFDYRFHWSAVPTLIVIIFTLVIIGGFIMLFIVMKQNSFASRVVEIQENQELIDTGLYSIVRHPMYLSFIIIFCFSPLVLGSFYSLIPVAFIPFLLTFRISNEEKVLMNGLKGFDLYMKKVKYRLIPFLW